ncbi:hypothetical protein GGR55DRAFT_346306 [Xylaria sp. FL0064]|nr:hypothetical protein GGR55DRAFT_346306 [Xylaria sp. FL0064]
MVKDITARNELSPHKRQTSLSGFFSKLLPSHRAEQGGTARGRDATNDSDSAYVDLGMNPNDLTEWNLAQERSVRPQPPQGRSKSQHHRGGIESVQRGRPRLRVDVGLSSQAPRRTSSLDIAQSSNPLEPLVPKVSCQAKYDRSRPITREEIRDMLKAKEYLRSQRRSLKESGDWLGVQGADPYSGEFAVLTPTSTLSSEATPTSSKNWLAELSQRQRAAKLAYEQARLEEVTERERILLQKGQSKLEKIEHAKQELRHSQRNFPVWSQHKRRWSSAAEPVLSPIPQSMKSGNAGGSSNDAATTTLPIRNFSRPSKSNGGSITDQPKRVEPPINSENTEPSKRNRHDNQSTDTIIHNVLPNMKLQDTTVKTKTAVYPAVFSDTSGSAPQAEKNEKSFLWRRRRRMSDPGKWGKRLNHPMMHPSAGKTEESLKFASVAEPPPPLPQLYPRQEVKDHFADLSIPDPCLDLAPYSSRTEKMEKPPTPAKRDPSPMNPTGPVQSSHSEAQSKPALSIATNLSACRDLQNDHRPGTISDIKGATVISSQSKPKGNTKPPPIYRRLIPLRSSSCHAKVIRAQESQVKPQSISQMPNHFNISLPKNILGPLDVQNQSDRRKFPRMENLDEHISINMNGHHEKDQGEYASTPTIIITGFDRDHGPQLLFEKVQSGMRGLKERKESTMDNHESPATSSSHSDERGLYGESSPEKERSTTTSSRLTTSQSDSQSFVLARETLETDTVSMELAIPGDHQMLSGQYLQARGSYQNPKSVPTNCAWGILEEFGIIIPQPRQQQRVANERQNIPAEEFTTRTGNRHRQRNKAQLAHQHEKPSELRETMIQEAARVAMQRSRAKEIVTTRSRTPSRTPSPCTQNTRPDIPSPPKGVESPTENGRSEGGDINTGFPLASTGFIDPPSPLQSSPLQVVVQRRGLGGTRRTSSQQSHPRNDGKKENNGRSDDNTKAGIIVILASLLITAYMVLFGLACAWWAMVYPAFDQSSGLWRRWRKREISVHDFGVITATIIFFVTGALTFVSAVRLAFWVVRIGIWALFQL